jgi:ubiquinone biosynthesis protein UbiJ
MSLITPFLKPMQIAINRYLDYDPEGPKQLAKMEGKVVALNFQPLDIKLFVILTSGGLDLLEEMDTDADTTITGSPLSLAMMGVNESSTASLFSGDVVIEGDIELGNQFQEFLENVEVDWEEPLSQLTGDVVANQIGHFARDLSSWMQESSKTNAMNVAEYFREEKRMLPSSFEVERFKKGVDELRLSTDRLEAKVQRLVRQQTIANESEGTPT